MSDTKERMLIGLQESRVPFTYRFFGLRLRLAFTKRRFCQVEKSYRDSLLTDRGRLNDLVHLLQSSFSSLRDEIERIEQGQENMKQRALPKVKEQLVLHDGFLCFLSGFREDKDDSSVKDNAYTPQRQCHLPLLNQGEETITAFKKLIAEFAGVPTGMLVHDLRILEGLLEEKEAAQRSMVEELETSRRPVKQEENAEGAL
jgi:uncharacterized protein YdcH (DUF465 family)